MDLLITGAGGQLGRELQRCAWPDGWRVTALGREDLDLADAEAVGSRIGEKRWAAVVNAAAYTAVDKAETEPTEAWAANALGVAALARACASADIPLVHVSTDYVFPGDKSGPWEVDDAVGPLGVYGASKLGGELAIRASGVRHAIVRTAWVVSAHGHNFVRTMLRLASMQDEVRVVGDQSGTPTGARDLAQTLMTIAVRLAEDPAAPTGTFHFSNAGTTTWAGFAAEIFHQSAARGGPTAAVQTITTADYPTPARRPANSSLGHAAIISAYGIEPRPWPSMLGEILDELIGVPR